MSSQDLRCGGGAHGEGATRVVPSTGPCRWVLALALSLMPAPGLADTILLTFHAVPGGVPIAGEGTDIAIVDYGTVSAFEPLGAGVSRSRTTSDYRISTQFGIRVARILGSTGSYTLQAQLLAASPVAWQVDGVTMSTVPAAFATLQPYGAVVPHTLAFVVPYTAAAGPLTSLFEVIAVAN